MPTQTQGMAGGVLTTADRYGDVVAGSGAHTLLQACWAAVLVSTPLYVFGSGLPQPSDFLAAGLMLAVAATGFQIPKGTQTFVLASIAFAAYTAAVNFVWAAVLGSTAFVRPPFFYAFNVVTVITCITMYTLMGDRFLKVTMYGVAGSVWVVIASTPLLFVPGSYRQELTFNNPNQLGYHGLLSATVLAIGRDRELMTGWKWGWSMVMAIMLVLFSTSKAAMLGAAFLLLLVLYRRPWASVAVAGVIAAAIPVIAGMTEFVRILVWRLSPSGGGADDNFAGRGYDRLVNHMNYVFLGAGEGEHLRFESVLRAELHSSWATIVFSYGLVGTVLFFVLFWSVLRATRFAHLKYFLPVLFYGVTHQGLRTTGLWILFAFSALIGLSMARERTLSESEPEP